MSGSARRAVSVIALLSVAFCAVGQVESETVESEPYREDEFPDWMISLRRAEIVATGTLPLTLLASRVVYSLIRFTVASIATGTINLDYAPGFFAPPGAPPLTQVGKLGVVAGAIGLSSIIAWIDYAILSAEAAEAE